MVVGIDYSLTSPAMCLMTGPNIETSMFYYLTSNKKFVGNFGNAIGVEHKEYYTEQERYDNIAEFFLNKIPIRDKPPNIFIEDYSFGSTGRVFHIAENAGLLKYKFWEVGYKFTTIAPSAIKKFATGKGNADKQKMYDAFVAETGYNLLQYYSKSETLGSPATDIVDSYYIAKYGYQLLNSVDEGEGDEYSKTKGSGIK
jgi:Holliday junction resolvasome RuvABC endonuclease subunit